MLSMQMFGAPRLKKHMEKPEMVQQTNGAQGDRLPRGEELAQGNRERSSLTWSLYPDHHIQTTQHQQPPSAAVYLDNPGTHWYDCPPYRRQ